MSKEISIYDKTSYKEMIQKNIYNTIEFLLKEGIEFSIICYTNFIEFNPSIPSEIIEFNEITLFAIAGYSYESSTITKTNFTFEAGFGEQNYGSYLKVPLEAIMQIVVNEDVLLLNYYEPKEEPEIANSMDILLNNPENLKLIKKRK